MRRVVWLSLLIAGPACASGRNAPPPAGPSTLPSSAPALVSLYRSPCYARCPVYTVSVSSDGVVTYEGKDQVRTRGVRRARVPKARVQALAEELEAAGYFEFAARYRPGEPVCGRYVPDAPTVITTLNVDGRTKRIEHDHGCGGAPMALRVLESRIDEELGSGRWTSR